MCVIVYKRADQEIDKATLKQCWTKNSDGAGFMLSTSRKLLVIKGLMTFKKFYESYRIYTTMYPKSDIVIHFRIGTHGYTGGPTMTHPFLIGDDMAVVHNGEISSYGINRRYLANFNYHCTLQTDTEVIAYLFDLLIRRQGLPMAAACMAMAPPFWSQIQRMEPRQQQLAKATRMVYGGALLNGPFSIVVGHSGGIIALNDRTKLRPMVAARNGDMLYVASEEAAVRELCPHPEKLWHARAGVPIVGELKKHTGPHIRPGAVWAQSAGSM